MNGYALSHRKPDAVSNGRASLDPTSHVVAFHREMNQLLDDAFGGFGFTRSPSNLPTVEVQEAEKEYRVAVDLPGVELKDIELSFMDGSLTVKAERKASTDGAALYTDRWTGGFERVIGIDAQIDESQIRASLQNGVLTVTLPKHPERLPRRIEIE
jgi:HSP20 family protein